MRDEHTCLQVNTNKDVASTWIGTEFGDLIRANEDIKVDVMREMVRQKTGLEFPAYIQYRAKKFALKQGKEEYTRSFSRLHRYGYAIRARDPGSAVFVNTIRYDPDINVPANFHRFVFEFSTTKLGYLVGCQPFIGIDGTYIKKPYEGVLLLVVALDANNGVYPLTLGVIDVENGDN